MQTILTVLTNYKRPANLPPVVDAFAAQTIPADIVVVDNSPTCGGINHSLESERINGNWRRHVKDFIRVRENLGPPCRFIPALAFHDYDYVYFHDEDMLPGPNALAHLLATANSPAINNEFATIGQYGRRFRGGPGDQKHPGRDFTYVLRHTARSWDGLVPVDMTCNAHFVRADLVRHALNLKWDLINEFGKEAVRPHIDRHDDQLLCLGIQRATGWGSWLTQRIPDDGESSLRRKRLRDNDAACARPTHRQERTELARMAGRIGWKSLWREILLRQVR